MSRATAESSAGLTQLPNQRKPLSGHSRPSRTERPQKHERPAGGTAGIPARPGTVARYNQAAFRQRSRGIGAHVFGYCSVPFCRIASRENRQTKQAKVYSRRLSLGREASRNAWVEGGRAFACSADFPCLNGYEVFLPERRCIAPRASDALSLSSLVSLHGDPMPRYLAAASRRPCATACGCRSYPGVMRPRAQRAAAPAVVILNWIFMASANPSSSRARWTRSVRLLLGRPQGLPDWPGLKLVERRPPRGNRHVSFSLLERQAAYRLSSVLPSARGAQLPFDVPAAPDQDL